jgi:hypothetical protein
MQLQKAKTRSACARNGFRGPVSLAAFVERPQAEHQIGAARHYNGAVVQAFLPGMRPFSRKEGIFTCEARVGLL